MDDEKQKKAKNKSSIRARILIINMPWLAAPTRLRTCQVSATCSAWADSDSTPKASRVEVEAMKEATIVELRRVCTAKMPSPARMTPAAHSRRAVSDTP